MTNQTATSAVKEPTARAMLIDGPVSPKTSIELANHLRGKSTLRAKAILEDAIALKRPIPFKRFTNGPGHKKGPLGSGRFAVKTCKHFLALITAVESNAHDKGLNTKHLTIQHLVVQRASPPWHYGRQSRRKMKRSHVELVVHEEYAPQKKEAAQPAPTKKQQPKKELSSSPKKKTTRQEAVKKTTTPAKETEKRIKG